MGACDDDQGNPTPAPELQPGFAQPLIALDHVRATDSIRVSAKWVMVASAAVAAVVVAGLQLKDISQVSGFWHEAISALLALAILGSIGLILRQAARVLVCTPMTLSRLADIDVAHAKRRAGQAKGDKRLDFGESRRTRLKEEEEARLYPYIQERQELLAALGIGSVLNLYHLYRGERLTAETPPSRDRIESAAEQLVTYVELRQVEQRYDLLVRKMGRCGTLFAVCLISLVFLIGSNKSSGDPLVTMPIPVKVSFTGEKRELDQSGFSGCTGTYDATAVSGSLRDPVVLIAPKGDTPNCHPHAREIPPRIGQVIYPRSPEHTHPSKGPHPPYISDRS